MFPPILILVIPILVAKVSGCDKDGHCDDPNAFCTVGDFRMCKCKSGFYEAYNEDFSQHKCTPIPANATFDCNKPSFPCGTKEANFGDNVDRKCFCLPKEYKKPIWIRCTPDKAGGRPCSDPNAYCSDTKIGQSHCKCKEKEGYVLNEINGKQCEKPPKNAIFFTCGTTHPICGNLDSFHNFNLNGKCFCIPNNSTTV